MENIQKEILKILEREKGRILQSNYPASEGSDILVNQEEFEFKTAKKGFKKWAKNKGVLANMENF